MATFNDIGAVPLSRDIGALQSEVAAAGTTVSTAFGTVAIAGQVAPNISVPISVLPILSTFSVEGSPSPDVISTTEVATSLGVFAIVGATNPNISDGTLPPVDIQQTINSLWIRYYEGQGFTGGSINDISLRAFKSKAGLSGDENISEAMKRYLDLVGVPDGTMQDRLRMFLDANYPALEGSLTDKIVQTLKNDEFFL